MTTDTMTHDNNMTKKSTWKRGLFMIMFGIIFSIAEFLMFAVAILQFLFMLFTGDGNEKLTKFGASLGIFVHEIADFLTLKSDEKPFPFKDWPTS